MPTRPRIYIDANGIIDAAKVKIKGPASIQGYPDPKRPQDIWVVQEFLRAAFNRDVEAFTSTISLAECTHIGEKPPEERVKERFESVLLSGQCLKLVQPSVFVCQGARDLTWDHGLSLKGADAIHVASAIVANCEELLTTDGGIIKQAKAITAAIGLKVLHASDTQLLPDEYRQLPLPT